MQPAKDGLSSTANLLLAALPPSDRARLEGAMRKVRLELGRRIFDCRDKTTMVYFPLQGAMVSMLQTDPNTGDTVEIGMIGREGAVGIHTLLGKLESPSLAQVQIGGPAMALPRDIAIRELNHCPAFRDTILRFTYVLLGQYAQAALCNRAHSIEERFARWLLMSLDRSNSDILPMTHELVGRMLGVTRSSVTLTVGIMQQAGLLDVHRGRIKVLDRESLEKVSCSCYAAVKKLCET